MSADELPELVFWGEESLMRCQAEVAAEDMQHADWSQKIDVLVECMSAYGGIGIAAPQIGWDARVFCLGIADDNARYPNAQSMPLQVWVNPQIVTSRGQCWAWEGCLSVPGLRGWISRPAEISVKGLNAIGDEVTQTLWGFAARVFQHEMDHLDGLLIPMRVPDARFLLSNELMENRQSWQSDWPSPGAYRTDPGVTSTIR
ncbi:MAG: peptide deformylase [Lysobacterales bacterium]